MDHHLVRHGAWIFLRNPKDPIETYLVQTVGASSPTSPKVAGSELIKALNALRFSREILKRGDVVYLANRPAAVCISDGFVQGIG